MTNKNFSCNHKMLGYINGNQCKVIRREKMLMERNNIILCTIETEPVGILFGCINDAYTVIVEPFSTFSITPYPIDFIVLSVSFLAHSAGEVAYTKDIIFPSMVVHVAI